MATAPGSSVTLFWSTRNVDSAAIYHLNSQGERTQVDNVAPDGRQLMNISSGARGFVQYVLAVGEGTQRVEQTLTISLECPIPWFFAPAPSECPNEEAQPTQLTEQTFERGLLLYAASSNRLYALFNDPVAPAWIEQTNLYDPAIHPVRDEAFERTLIGTNFVQPVGRLGYWWRGNDTVRNRMGLGTAVEVTFDGFVQTAPVPGRTGSSLYITGSNGLIYQLLPGGEVWQIITPS